MTHNSCTADGKIFSGAFLSLVFAQFLSAFADNALIFALLAQLVSQGQGGHSSLLQELFVIPYILLAPFVGPAADAFSKPKVMLVANGIKMLGTGMAFSGLSPFISYGIVGIGACLYSPAKYGILPQMMGKEKLVKANSAMEGGTIAAILLGALAGGMLSANSIELAVGVCLGAYVLAAISNLFIPKLAAEKEGFPSLLSMLKDFVGACTTLWKDKDAKSSIIGTSSFWGAGAALRLTLVAWIPFALHLNGPQWVSYMMGALSVGIVIGAGLAAAFSPLDKIHRAYIAGLFIGVCVIALAFSQTFLIACIISALVGVVGGFHVIPLNAMLQEKGHENVGAGRALAVQNVFENAFILAFAFLFSTLSSDFNPTHIAEIFGILMIFNGILTFVLFKKNKTTKK